MPVDPDHPVERLAYALSDARVRFLLTQSHLRARLPDLPAVEVVEIDQLDMSQEIETAPEIATHPEQLAYIIYTSGSTGHPKGVEVAHGPLSMHCQSTGVLYDMTPQSRELHFLSIAFDGAHERWLVPLVFGSSIVLRDQRLWSPEETYEALRRHAVTNAGFPPSYLHQLAEWADKAGSPPVVQLYSFGGEAMPRASFELVKQALRPSWLINGYGPTEAVISPLVWKVSAQASFEVAYAPIGRAVGARRAYVLDADLNPVPIGVAGELYLGGEGLARGYHAARQRRPNASCRIPLPRAVHACTAPAIARAGAWTGQLSTSAAWTIR